MYYHLHSFYQNHKRYVRSRNDAQLAGKTTVPGVKCQPEQFLGGNSAQPINPCGLIAWSLFNDSFSATVSGPVGARSTPLNLNVRAPALIKYPGTWTCTNGLSCPTPANSARAVSAAGCTSTRRAVRMDGWLYYTVWQPNYPS